VADPIFFLVLNLSGADPSQGVIHSVASSVFEKLGFAGDTRGEALRELDAELGRAGARGAERCEIRFRADAGSLAISVHVGGRHEWRLTRPLPPTD
jgi:hypothetical protein